MKGILDKWLPAINIDEELKTFEKNVNRLTDLESDILAAVENEEIQPGRKRKREVESWLNNVTTKKSELSQIKSEIKEKGSSRNLKNHIEKETKEVEELIQQGDFPKGVALDDHASTRFPMVTTKLLGRSFANNTKEILELLKEDSVFVVGVYGMGGVGKTTLVKEIHNILLSDSEFARRIYWVTASRDCSLEKLQNDIGKEVGLGDISAVDNERKKANLLDRFSTMEKCVLIIDDLWNHYLLERIGIPSESCSNCKVIVTTRSWDICRKMQCQQVFKIEPLSKPDSWTLFIRYSGDVPSNFKAMAESIVEECGGLPLALITMGCCMRDNGNVHDWKNTLYELRRPARRENEMEDEVFRILKVSFDNLKDVKVQNCFLNCLLFREDEKIDRDDLVNLCIDEGLLDEIENQQDRINKGHVMLNRLVNACLLESGSFEFGSRWPWVRMHDLIRDVGIIITQKHSRFMAKSGLELEQVPEEEQWSIDLIKVSLSWNYIEKIPSGMAPMTPNLTFLLLGENSTLKEIPESFFRHMKALKVLNLSSTSIERVPESVSDLLNLRMLLLEECRHLRYVPSVVKLIKLRVLNLYECDLLEAAPIGLERLKGVEVLNYCPWDISEKSGFNQLIQSSSISSNSYRFWIRDPKLFKTIEKSKFNGEKTMFWESESEKGVWITGWEYREDESSWLFPNTLEALGMEQCEMKSRSLGDVLPSLGLALGEAAMLNDISIVESRGMISITKVGALDSFSHLERLDIRGCPDMKVVFPFTEHPPHLPNLYFIGVTNCEEVEEIFQSNSKVIPILSLPRLNVIELIGLPKLKLIFPMTQQLHLPMLEFITVSDCEQVTEIFESNLIIDLRKLQSLLLRTLQNRKPVLSIMEYCQEVATEIFQANNNATVSLFESSPIILSLPQLYCLHLLNLPKLDSIYRGLLLCSSLEELFLKECPKLKLLPLPDNVIGDESWSPTTESILTNTKLWETLRRDYPQQAHLLSHYIYKSFSSQPS